MKPMDLLEWLRGKFTGQSIVYPEQCGICGLKTEGNRITGYFLPCGRYPEAMLFHHQVEFHAVNKQV